MNSGETATRALGIGCEIEKVTDVDAIVEGKVASAEELEALLKG